MDLYNKGYLDDVVVDIENQRSLTRFLDAGETNIFLHIVVIRVVFSVQW